MSKMVGQDMLTGMGFIGTKPGMYRMTPPYTYGEAEGTAISVESKAGPLKGLRVMGRTEQKRATGAQLLDTSKLTTRNSTADIAENGRIITINGKSAYSGLIIRESDISMFDNLIGKDVFISAKFRGNSLGASILIALSYKTQDNNTIKYLSVPSNLSEGAMFLSRSIPEDAILSTLQININHSDTELDKEQTVIFEDLIIGAGTTALPWEPYTGGIPSPNPDYPQEMVSVGDGGSVGVSVSDGTEDNVQSLTLATPNGLPGIPVTDASLANYTDGDGNMWCCDEVDLERGVYVQRIGKYILTEVDDMSRWAGIKDKVTNFRSNARGAKKDGCALCNRLKRNEYIWSLDVVGLKAVEKDKVDFTLPYDLLGITANATFEERKNACTQWLKDNELICLCDLENPIETPLSATELAAYRALHTNNPVTTITNSDNAHMIIKYKKGR